MREINMFPSIRPRSTFPSRSPLKEIESNINTSKELSLEQQECIKQIVKAFVDQHVKLTPAQIRNLNNAFSVFKFIRLIDEYAHPSKRKKKMLHHAIRSISKELLSENRALLKNIVCIIQKQTEVPTSLNAKGKPTSQANIPSIQIPPVLILPKASQKIASNRGMESDNKWLHENTIIMAQALDRCAEICFKRETEHAVRHALKDAEKSSSQPLTEEQKIIISQRVEKQVYKKVSDTIQFFVTVDNRKGSQAPLERIASIFDFLTRPTDGEQLKVFNRGISEYASELIKLAFEQHLDNPEQYVSHGFDHSINVADSTRDVMRLNPEIVVATKKKYGISEGEAKFMLESVALLHDSGYPCVGCRQKSVHGIAGADLVLSLRPMFNAIIISPNANKEGLFNDFRNSILFHSADKIEESFSVKIVTTLGTFLADNKNIVQVLSNFYDPSKNPSGQPRYVVEVYVQNSEMQAEITTALHNAHKDTLEKVGRPEDLPRVKVHKGLFKGRFADLEFNKDKQLGLEFSSVDLLDSPLSMIRLVDNMDMSQTRLSALQNEAPFRQLYYTLGNNKEISQFEKALEGLDKEIDNLKKDKDFSKDNPEIDKKEIIAKIVQDTLQKQIAKLRLGYERKVKEGNEDLLIKRLLGKFNSKTIQGLKIPKEAKEFFLKALIDSIFEDGRFAEMSQSTKDAVRSIGMYLSSVDLSHFGGCEAVKNVKLVGIPVKTGKESTNIPVVVVTVDKVLFDDFNTISVTESSLTLDGKKQSVTLGVGEYQIWRASEAYRSLTLGGAKLQLRIVDEQDNLVKLTIPMTNE